MKQNKFIDFLKKNFQFNKDNTENIINLTTTDTSINQKYESDFEQSHFSDSDYEISIKKKNIIEKKTKVKYEDGKKNLERKKISNLKKIFHSKDLSENFNKSDFIDDIEHLKNQRDNVIQMKETNNDRKIHNHIESNYNLSNKKCLFYNMKNYHEIIQENVFEVLPLTFHLQNGLLDPEYKNFIKIFKSIEEDKKLLNIWIIKPGELTNRGCGIEVCNNLDDIDEILSRNEFHPNGKQKTYIVQKYIEKPLLYNKRKFDIRCYILITNSNGIFKGIINIYF